ncbi:MAG: vanadium-dependent haloperoxidase [Chitinophagaceae bacterium]
MTLVLVILVAYGCGHREAKQLHFTNRHISDVITQMTDIMVHDVTNPPLAARFFSYACLAGYEVIAQHDAGVTSMHAVLNGYPDLKRPDSIRGYSYELAALLAMMETARKLQPSGRLFDAFEKNFLDSCQKAGCSKEEIARSRAYALAVTKHILIYAKADGYNRISNYTRYTPAETEGAWYPTPPAYIAAVEPYFRAVRPLTLDSSTQFKPTPPIPFSTEKSSSFYKLMLQNYNDTLSAKHRMMAAYWDCNPFAVQDNGHLLVGLKKISPGAHWLGIAGTACRKAGTNFNTALQVFSTVSIGLMDGFICCWEEKYRSNRIRPETAIRNLIDPSWTPLLQTPPFPEYLSGHSTISAASATILTGFFGEDFHFTDSTEMKYGLGVRAFSSFQQAAEEAALSRFYGGIHFMDAIDKGLEQGQKVGAWVLSKTKHTVGTKNNTTALRGER